MSGIRIEGVCKRYDASVAVDEVSLELRAGAFLTLLGPSGCGKTTTLRILAGLAVPDRGRVLIGTEDVTHVPTFRRNIGMVFQNLALFPHMSVTNNVAFGLRMRGVPPDEQSRMVREALALVHLEAMSERYPHQLSGGQQQRVALARALVYKPSVLLLDEPFAALDRKLREAMQVELRDLTRRIGITTIFVTHDQHEALVMSDLIAVMNEGRIEQCGAPIRVYEHPATPFVADFMGARNLIDAKVLQLDGGKGATIEFLGARFEITSERQLTVGQSIVVAIRPERIHLDSKPPSGSGIALEGTVQAITYHGGSSSYEVFMPLGKTLSVSEENAAVGNEGPRFKAGQRVFLSWQVRSLHPIQQSSR